nr:hypothetical protein [Synergistaceae bacterium]
GLIAFIIVELFPAEIADIFGAKAESVHYLNFAVKCFRIYLCMVILACVNKAAFIFLQSLGRPWLSTMLSLVREIIFGVGLTVLMPALPFIYGLDGLLWSMPASDLLTFIISLIVIVKVYKQLED